MRHTIVVALGWFMLMAMPALAVAAECKHDFECSDGDACTVDKCIRPGKTCKHIPVPNGQTCNDGNACTVGDICQSGACTPASNVVCTATDQCHVAGTCDPLTGACSNPNAPDGVTCNDRNLCTQTDTCQTGACVGANPIECTPIDLCHVAGTCNQNTGLCSNPPINPSVCNAVDQCNLFGNNCDSATGACSNPNKPDGTACNDGDACMQTDACLAGSCVGSNPVACEDAAECQLAGTCDSFTGTCSGAPAPDGTPCTSASGLSCSASAQCVAAACAANGTDDADSDGICDADDNCPATANPEERDLDSDGIGDVCDPSDAPLSLRQARVRPEGGRRSRNGSIAVRGTFPVSAADSFSGAAGIVAHVTDAAGLDASFTWSTSECGTYRRGRIVCRSISDPASQAKFRPLVKTPGLIKFSLRIAHLGTSGHVTAPLGVTVTDDAAIDRVGSASVCRTVRGGQTCTVS